VGAPRRKRKERTLWGSTGRKSFLPAEKQSGKEFEKPFVPYNSYKRRSDLWFWLYLGFGFAPRIRDLAYKRLYVPGKDQRLPAPAGLIGCM
jgi:hypothetical protein